MKADTLDIKKQRDIAIKPLKRLATEDEIKAIYTHMANADWKTSVKYASTIGHEDVSIGYAAYLKRQFKFYTENIGETIIAHHFEEYNITLFSFLFTLMDSTDNHCFLSNSMLLKVGNTFKNIDDYDYIDLDQEIKELTVNSTRKAGRPKTPSEKNILKTHNIKILIENGSLVDEACAKEGIAKSTYYRVSKWIVKNTHFKTFP